MEFQGKGILKIKTSHRDHLLYVFVEDTGSGIPEDKIKNIWDPFFTTKRTGKGTGLGLTISKQIIENHGGTIKVENLPEKGTRFTIELPC